MQPTPIFLITSIAIVSSWMSTDIAITNAKTLGTNSSYANSIALATDDRDMTPVQKNGKWGYVDKTNGRTTKFSYDEADYFSQGLGKVKTGTKYGFINRMGKIVIPIQYDEAETFYGGDKS